MRALSRLAALAGQLRDERSGVAFTEFALSLPVLLILGLMGIETAHFALAVQKCSEIAMITADNASRVRISIDEADVNDIMTGAKLAGASIGFAANGRIILSDLEPNGLSGSKKGQYIRWQRCSGARNVTSSYGVQGAGTTDGSLQGMGPSGNTIASMDGAGNAVMFAEVQYNYQPIVGASWIGGTRIISYTSAFTVRQRTDQVLYNSNNLSSSQISNCANFSA